MLVIAHYGGAPVEELVLPLSRPAARSSSRRGSSWHDCTRRAHTYPTKGA